MFLLEPCYKTGHVSTWNFTVSKFNFLDFNTCIIHPTSNVLNMMFSREKLQIKLCVLWLNFRVFLVKPCYKTGHVSTWNFTVNKFYFLAFNTCNFSSYVQCVGYDVFQWKITNSLCDLWLNFRVFLLRPCYKTGYVSSWNFTVNKHLLDFNTCIIHPTSNVLDMMFSREKSQIHCAFYG